MGCGDDVLLLGLLCGWKSLLELVVGRVLNVAFPKGTVKGIGLGEGIEEPELKMEPFLHGRLWA